MSTLVIMAARTVEQLKTTIENKIDAGLADG